ncbi:hypothetical protein OHT52_24835 [Streptomyces sp. NBC_00247]|uniref:hypothetical protein n=1 Tax=Streptomyces sp. NBC_00247 TaxID=2975689 RepID=UPI002E2C1ADC|nr:hypothetical protein [Streptomyces sp. NBC_00247]
MSDRPSTASGAGVLADNARAVRYYEKNGFWPFGSFAGADGSPSPDLMADLRELPDPAPALR